MRDGCKLLLFRDFGIIKAADDNVPRILAVGLQVLSQRMGKAVIVADDGRAGSKCFSNLGI